MVVKVQAEFYSLVESYLRLPGAVDVTGVPALHDALPMVQLSLNDPVPDGLGHDELRVLRAVHVELAGDVSEGDLAVGQGDGLDCGLDDIMMESRDQSVGVVSSELVSECVENLSKSLDLS